MLYYVNCTAVSLVYLWTCSFRTITLYIRRNLYRGRQESQARSYGRLMGALTKLMRMLCTYVTLTRIPTEAFAHFCIVAIVISSYGIRLIQNHGCKVRHTNRLTDRGTDRQPFKCPLLRASVGGRQAMHIVGIAMKSKWPLRLWFEMCW